MTQATSSVTGSTDLAAPPLVITVEENPPIALATEVLSELLAEARAAGCSLEEALLQMLRRTSAR